MCDLTDAYISGAWHGGLAVLFIVAGLLGWPQTRFILMLIFRRNPRKPIGSPGTISSPFWNQYGVHRSERGFAIGPILYLLGLIGVVAGVLFSNNMQVLKSNVTVQNSVTSKSDLQAAATTLAAQSVFSSDSMTLCPPRSIHETNGNPCNAAPIGLTQFGDLPVSELSQLPSGYANAASTGSPTEVGVFAPGAGTRMLDPYGHLYIYCRWENQRNNPGAPAFVLLSAGDDGVLQTSCGSSAAQHDDYLISVSVGEAINRSAVWQAQGSNGVSYGARGSQVYIDNSGNMTVTNLTASNAATIGTNLSANSLNALNATITGVATVGSINSGSATISGPLSATDGSFTGITATGTITGDTGTFTTLNAGTATITGAATAASLTTTGDVTAKDVIASMNISGSNGNFSIVNAGSVAVTNGITAASLTTTGDINAGDLIAVNNVSGATGTFGTGNITTGNITTGNITNINATSENVTGDTTMNNLTVDGTLTANNFSFSGSANGSSGTFTTMNVTNATISNILTANSETVTNALSAGSFSTSGSLTAGSATLGSLAVTNNASIGGNITTSGTDTANNGNFGSITVTNNAIVDGRVGIGNASPGALLDLGLNGTTTGTLRLESGGTGYVQIQPSATTSSSYTLTLPSAAPTNSGYVLSSTTSGVLSWVANGSGGSALSLITSATTTNSFDSTSYAQTWNWNSLAGASALTLSTTSTAAASNAQTLLNINMAGANTTTGQTTYGEKISNTHTGSGTNVGLYANASGGTNNYAALFPNGDVGIGTTTPGNALSVYAYNTTPLYVNTSYGSPAAYFSTGNGAAINAVGGGSGASAMFATVASGSSVRAVVLIGQPNGNTGDLLEFETGGGTTIDAVKYNGAFAIGTQSSANMLDVYGSAAIGKSYAGSIAAPTNGLIVQGNVGVGTSSPTSILDVNGEIQAGNSGANCTASNAGAIRYNSTNQLMQYCNGSAWNPFESACAVGTAVGSGICAGQIVGKNLIVAPSGCPASASTASQCSGADIQMWYQNNGNSNNGTMIYGGDGVAAQTAALVYYASIGRTTPTSNIAEYCKSITIDGKTWHAPSVAELEIISTNYSIGALSAANFGTGFYWSANDDYANNAAAITFSTGTVFYTNNSYENGAIRCVTLE